MSGNGNEEKGLLVIGAGLCRTGTNSLKLALELLLDGKCYHMEEIFEKRGEPIEMWIKAHRNKGLSAEEWRSVFAGYKACVDYPEAPLFEHLMSIYPNAKVILSLREPMSWVKSVKNTIAHSKDLIERFPTNIFLRMIMGRWETLWNAMLNEFSMTDIINNEQKAAEDFVKWNDHVKSKVPSEKLLIFEATMGWKPLCEFLNLPIPDVDYPRVNDTKQFNRIIKLIKCSAYAIIIGIPVACATGAFFLMRSFLL